MTMEDSWVFSQEIITLMTIEQMERLARKPTRYLNHITDSHIDYLYNSLVKRGYLVANNPEVYQLTARGWNAILREAVLLVACEDEVQAKDRIKKLEGLYAEISQQLDILNKEETRVFA